MQSRKVTLFIPALLGPKDLKKVAGALDGLVLTELALFLSRAATTRIAPGGFSGVLFGLFGIEPEPGGDLPVAAVTRLTDMDGASSDHHWLRADPVHLKADRDRIVMFGNRDLNVTIAEAGQLRDEFNHLFGEDGLHLEAPTPHRWYLRLPRAPKITTTPLQDTVGLDIHPLLPQGEEAMNWHKLLNEAQMLFHSSVVNQQRETNHQPTINSLWLWGGGALPARKAVSWQGVWSNETQAAALASYFGVAHGSAAASAEDLLEQIDAGEHLVVLDGAIEAVQFQDIGAWRQFVEGISSEWITPLLRALKQGELTELRVVTTEGACYTLSAKRLRRWWQRRRPLSSFMT